MTLTRFMTAALAGTDTLPAGDRRPTVAFNVGELAGTMSADALCALAEDAWSVEVTCRWQAKSLLIEAALNW